MSERPILVTGSNRSGTTWLMTMLGLAPGTLRVYEPLSFRAGTYRLGDVARCWYPYTPELPQDEAADAFRAVLQGKTSKVFRRRQIQKWIRPLRRGRMVIKDSNACFSAEWLCERFPLDVVVLVRHPGAYAASIKRMGWTFDFDNFLQQPKLMGTWLEPYRAEMEAGPRDLVAQASLLWRCIYHALLGMAERHPGWLVRTHEALSLDPGREIRALYDALDLPWTEAVARGIAAYTGQQNDAAPEEGVAHSMRRDSAANAHRWRELLEPDEIDRLYEETRPLAGRFYDEASWGRG